MKAGALGKLVKDREIYGVIEVDGSGVHIGK